MALSIPASSGVRRSEARKAAVRRGVGVGEEAGGGPGLRGEDAALQVGGDAAEGGLLRWICDGMQLRGGNAGGCGDALVEQIVGELPCAGIAVALGDAQAQGGFDEVAAAEVEQGAGLGLVGCEHRDADAAGDGNHTRSVGCDVFDCGEVEVDGGCRRAGLLPLVGIAVHLAVCAGFTCVVEGAWREFADAHDAGLHGAAEAVGVGEQRGLRRRCGFDLRGPEAGGDPECERVGELRRGGCGGAQRR